MSAESKTNRKGVALWVFWISSKEKIKATLLYPLLIRTLVLQLLRNRTNMNLDDWTFIREIQHIKCGVWEQYDVLLDARGYGWEDMKAWAEYMSKNDLDVSHGTLTVAGMVGTKEKEIIEQYHSVGNIQMIPALETEQGVISMGGTSQKLHSPVKIVWMNQTRCLRIFTLVNDEILIRRYIETVIRRTFGTPDEMKLAKPIIAMLPEINGGIIWAFSADSKKRPTAKTNKAPAVTNRAKTYAKDAAAILI